MMAAENVSGLVYRVIKTLESSTLNEIKWIGTVKDELEAIAQTLVAINRVLPDAQSQQSKNNTAIRKWLQDLTHVAADIEDEINLILAQHESNLKAPTLRDRFPRTRKAAVVKALGRRLSQVDRTRKQFELRERPPFPACDNRSVWWCFTTALVREKSLDKAVQEVDKELSLRVDAWRYRTGARGVTPEQVEKLPEFMRFTPRDPYLIQNSRASENRQL